jgi:hypothetical protein
MRRSLLVGALLIGIPGMSSAAEVHIDEDTLCPVALRAFDETDLPAIEEFLRFVQGVLDELNARHTDQEETAPTAKLTGKSIEVLVILGYCRQHLSSTIYQETADTYRAMRALRTPLSSGWCRGSDAETAGQRGYVALPTIKAAESEDLLHEAGGASAIGTLRQTAGAVAQAVAVRRNLFGAPLNLSSLS